MSRRALWLLPLFAIAASWIWLAWEAGRWLPLDVVVHEDGRRTLARTVWYPRHFLREIPVLLFYLAALVVSVPSHARQTRTWPGWIAAVGAALLVAWAIVAVVWRHGLDVAAGDLGQYYRRDDDGARGVHWGSHYVSNFVVFGVAWVTTARRRPRGRGAVAPAAVLAAVGFGSILLVASPFDAVLSPRSAAHQVREVITHVAVTLPLGLACLAAWPTAGQGRVASGSTGVRLVAASMVCALGGLSAIAVGGGALDEARASWSGRLAAHVLEHTLDYVFVVLVCVALRRRVVAVTTAAGGS